MLPIYSAHDFAVAIPAMPRPVPSLAASAYVAATITAEYFRLAAIPGFVHTVADIAEFPFVKATVVATVFVRFEFGASMFVVAKLAVTK